MKKSGLKLLGMAPLNDMALQDRGKILTSLGVIVLFICFPVISSLFIHPRVVIPLRLFDDNKIELGSTSEFQIGLRNYSPFPVRVETLIPSCHCTQIKFEPSDVGLFHSLSVPVSFTATAPVGTQYVNLAICWRPIFFPSNRLYYNVFHFPLTVIQSFSLNPERGDFGSVAQGSSADLQFRISCNNSEIVWDNVVVKHGSYAISVKAGNDKAGCKLELRLDSKLLPLGVFHSILTFNARHGANVTGPEFRIPVRAKISGPINIKPEELYLGALKKGDLVSREIWLTSASGDIKKVECDAEEVNFESCRVLRVEKNRAEVSLTLNPSMYGGGQSLDAHLRIVADQIFNVSVPCYYFISGRSKTGTNLTKN